jgi:hypothetical protein
MTSRPTTSPFDPNIPVAYLPLNSRSHAFAVRDPDAPCIIVNETVLDEDWFTEDHLMIVLAHETGHILGETSDEMTADELGMELMESAGMPETLEMYQEEYKTRIEVGHYDK